MMRSSRFSVSFILKLRREETREGSDSPRARSTPRDSSAEGVPDSYLFIRGKAASLPMWFGTGVERLAVSENMIRSMVHVVETWKTMLDKFSFDQNHRERERERDNQIHRD